MPGKRVQSAMSALAGLMLLWTPASTMAVYVSPNGIGQVLLYPYYTARATSAGHTYNTLIEVTNTSSDSKVLRVRFRESRNGRVVGSLNVSLVPFDSWTAAVVPGTSGPQLVTTDASCTDPAFGGSTAPLIFSNEQYSGINSDGEDTSFDRAGTGYLEIIDLGVIADPALLSALVPNRADQGFGIHPDCKMARTLPVINGSSVLAPTGGLMGNAYIVNVADGTLYSYAATALDNFSQVPLWSTPTLTSGPTLEDVNPKVSDVFDKGSMLRSNWDTAKGAQPADAVSAVLMNNRLINSFVLDPSTQSATDWIVTMPTKPYYVPIKGHGVPLPPFESAFANGGAPDYFGLAPTGLNYPDAGNTQVYNREGYFLEGTFDLGPNPPPPTLLFRWTANVLTFNNSNLFAADSTATLGGLYENGWALLEPFQYANAPRVHRLVSTDTPPAVYFGLPMIGFMANDYVNGTITGTTGPVLSNYGATSPHKGVAHIE